MGSRRWVRAWPGLALWIYLGGVVPDLSSHDKWLRHTANPKPGDYYETGSDGAAGRPPTAVFCKNLIFRAFLVSGVVRMGLDRP